MQLAILASIAFIHQDKDIGIVIAHGILAYRGLEFINNRGDDALLVITNKLRQVSTSPGLQGFRAAMAKSLVDLVIEVHAVGDQDDLKIIQTLLQSEPLGQ